MAKKMRIMFASAGLTLISRAQVYLCLRCYHKLCGDKERVLLDVSAYDEFKHPSIFEVCALLLILLRINERKTILSSFCPVLFFYKIIIIIYANVHVTIT